MNSRGECQSLRGREIDRGERERDTARTKQRERERRQGGGRIRGFHTVTLDSIQKSTQKSPMDRGQYTPAYASLRPPPPYHSLSLSIAFSGWHSLRQRQTFHPRLQPASRKLPMLCQSRVRKQLLLSVQRLSLPPLSGEPNRCAKLLHRNALVCGWVWGCGVAFGLQRVLRRC